MEWTPGSDDDRPGDAEDSLPRPAPDGHDTVTTGDRDTNGRDDRRDQTAGHTHGRGLYRLGDNPSNASIFQEVEMAQDELFSGPVAESLPTSTSAFAHRRARADSVVSATSFSFYEPDDDETSPLTLNPDHGGGSGMEDLEELPFEDDDEESGDEDGEAAEYGGGLELAEDGRHGHKHPNGRTRDRHAYAALAEDDDEDNAVDPERGVPDNDYVVRRRSSTLSETSVHSRLLRRGSGLSAASSAGGATGNRKSQKIYMVNEDLYIVIAGFKTSPIGLAAYLFICIATLGIGWLLFRWLPRWHVKLIGQPAPLRECRWVVVENQWNEMAILLVRRRPYDRSLSTVFGAPSKMDIYLLGEDQDPILPDLLVLDYRYVRFCFHPARDKFVICSGWKDPQWTDVRTIRTGIEHDEKMQREGVFGRNSIDIEQKSTFRLLFDEAFHPFYVFQIASIVLWSLEVYYYYAVAIFVMSVMSITTTLLETKSTMRKLRAISQDCDVRVLRNGFWRYIPSTDLVPGDIYEVSDPSLTQFPADSLLLGGDCIVNESMLTGESVPVSKSPATDETLRLLDLAAPTMLPAVAKHFLFCGTKIIRARRPQDHDRGFQGGEAVALAMVVRTGFNTTKGALVRSMLFPKPSGFKFYRDSFRYISVMAGIATVGFVASLFNLRHLHLSWPTIIVRALDLITVVVPPALPATLSIGTNFALSRLKKQKIFCISPQRVNVGGKLDLMCFDKTGTLTEDGLDILGVRVVSRAERRFSDLLTDPEALVPNQEHRQRIRDAGDAHKAALYTMATCHSLRSLDGELVGDPLDVKMFEFTGWTFEEGSQGGGGGMLDDDEHGTLQPSVARPPSEGKNPVNGNGSAYGPNGHTSFELGILRTFEFVSNLRRATVIVRAFGQPSGDVYVKGAPECMREICRPESFPDDYEDLLSYYTHKGYRVIGCATKHLKKLSWVKSQKMKRRDAESDLDFVGFIIFENKLKPTTTAVIEELTAANIGTVMITGDNILTAISVARECCLISKTAHCFVPHFIEGKGPRDPNGRLQWESIDNQQYRLDERTLLPIRSAPAPDGDNSALPASPCDDFANMPDYCIAATGDVFRWVVDFAPPEVLRRMLVTGKVFARMSPDEKHELVEKLQGIGYCCGFCGDGANDCGALKAADVGISLSEAEASVAAPFTSRVFDIRCVPRVIREGRAALVTSFSCFQYMSLYSAIQFTTVSFLYASGSNLGDFQFLLIDLALTLPVAVFMSWAGPPALSSSSWSSSSPSSPSSFSFFGFLRRGRLGGYGKRSRRAVAAAAAAGRAYRGPEEDDWLCRKRPSANLVSRKVLTPLLGQMAVCVAVQTAAFVAVRRQPWFVPPRVTDPDDSNIENSENTVLFLVSCFEYILAGVVLNAGRPFRQSAIRNWPFVVNIIVVLAFTGYMVWSPTDWLAGVMELTPISRSFKVFLIELGVVYLALAWLGQRFVFHRLARLFGRAKLAVTKQPKKRKEYKVILERMRF